KPAEHDLPFSAWSLSKLAEFLVAEGVVDDISHEGLRIMLREEGVSFQRLKTWKASKDPRYAAKKARVEHLYAIADRDVAPGAGEQRRDRLYADQFIVVEPHRGPVHGPALLRARRDRPRQPQGAGQHDPPVHHLAQQPRLRRTTPPHRRPGKRSLMRH